MLLTSQEFKLIRPLQWTTREFGGRLYNTIIDETETALFWYDFIRFVFAPKFKNQWGVVNIANFDQTQPVLLTDQLELKLPNLFELAVYYADNKKAPFYFALKGIRQIYVMIIGLIALLVILIISLIRKSSASTNELQII
nr:putative Ac68-like protein [Apis mellifera nudivirus]